MPVNYINRVNEAHYLKAVKTKHGKERYYIVKNISNLNPDELLSEVPEGFEFYEFPEDARVSLRKKLRTIITGEEIKTVDMVMKEHETVKDYLLDKDHNGILVYTGRLDREEFRFQPEE